MYFKSKQLFDNVTNMGMWLSNTLFGHHFKPSLGSFKNNNGKPNGIILMIPNSVIVYLRAKFRNTHLTTVLLLIML